MSLLASYVRMAGKVGIGHADDSPTALPDCIYGESRYAEAVVTLQECRYSARAFCPDDDRELDIVERT